MIYLMLCCRLIYKMNVEVCIFCYILVEICCLILKSNVYFYNKKKYKDYFEMDKDECIYEY